MSQAVVDVTARASGGARSLRTLDDLAALPAREAEALYRQCRAPARMDLMDGDLVGRMLAVTGSGGGRLLQGIAGVARAGWFPWEGKTFQSRGKDEGTGINRVRLGGRHRLFPFRTHFGPSVIDGQPALVLDYDDPDNPGVIRAIHDEVREVAPGLYFGPACLKKKAGGTSTALWFALDARGVNRAARPS